MSFQDAIEKQIGEENIEDLNITKTRAEDVLRYIKDLINNKNINEEPKDQSALSIASANTSNKKTKDEEKNNDPAVISNEQTQEDSEATTIDVTPENQIQYIEYDNQVLNDDGSISLGDTLFDSDNIYGLDFSNDFDRYSKEYLNSKQISNMVFDGSEEEWKDMLSNPYMKNWYMDEGIYDDNGNLDNKLFHEWFNKSRGTSVDDVLDSRSGTNMSEDWFGTDGDALDNIYSYLSRGNYAWSPSDRFINEYFGGGMTNEDVVDWLQNTVYQDPDMLKGIFEANHLVNAGLISDDYDNFKAKYDVDDFNKLAGQSGYTLVSTDAQDAGDYWNENNVDQYLNYNDEDYDDQILINGGYLTDTEHSPVYTDENGAVKYNNSYVPGKDYLSIAYGAMGGPDSGYILRKSDKVNEDRQKLEQKNEDNSNSPYYNSPYYKNRYKSRNKEQSE